MGARVTKRQAFCEDCGAELAQPPVGRRRRHCTNACKQRSYRRRRAQCALVHLTPGLRQRLKVEIDRRRRAQVERFGGYAAVEREERERGRAA
jgi:hypothetical protein